MREQLQNLVDAIDAVNKNAEEAQGYYLTECIRHQSGSIYSPCGHCVACKLSSALIRAREVLRKKT